MEDSHYDFIYNQELNHWWYKVRRKIIRDLTDSIGMRKGGAKILDVGCGGGAQAVELGECGEVYGLDFSEKAVEFCRSRNLTNVKVGDITNISHPNDMFDLVIALDVIEHVENDTKALGEIYRVLKPGGYAIIFVPAFMFLWSVTDEDSHHFRRYTLSELKQKVSQQKFEVARSSYFNSFLFPPILLVRGLVRLFRLPMKSEESSGEGFMNNLFYRIFLLESAFLKRINFPAGVSALMVIKKPS